MRHRRDRSRPRAPADGCGLPRLRRAGRRRRDVSTRQPRCSWVGRGRIARPRKSGRNTRRLVKADSVEPPSRACRPSRL